MAGNFVNQNTKRAAIRSLVDPSTARALAQRGFHIYNDLGKGAFGEVLKAKCQDDDKFYAIKFVPLSNGASPKYIARELELLIKLELSERNVIKYYKSWILSDGNNQRLCIQMELVFSRFNEIYL